MASLVDLLLHRDSGGSDGNRIPRSETGRYRACAVFTDASKSVGKATGHVPPRWFEVVFGIFVPAPRFAL